MQRTKKRWFGALLLAFLLGVSTLYIGEKQTKAEETSQKVIVINPGHQAKANLKKEAIGPGSSKKKYKVTGGCTGVSTKKAESKVNLEVGLKLKKELEARGYKVIMTRTTQNVNLSNQDRAKIGNKHKADAVIHLHCDSAGSSASGAHTIAPASSNPYVSKSVCKKSQTLAKKLISSYCKKTGMKKRIKGSGVSYRNDLTGLNWAKVPAVYIELGFLSNRTEDKQLNNKNFQKKCAKGMADGIDAFLE